MIIRFKKQLLFGTALIVLALLALSALFYRPTRLALERAEAFHFRRMVLSQQGEQSFHRFFYVSNRRLEPDDGTFEERFTNERQEALNFGLFDTRIKPTLGLGMITNPTDWFQNEELKVRDVSELSRAAFINELREKIKESPLRSLLVLVQGYRNSFPMTLRMSAFVGHVLDINTPVLVFDWPGDQGSGIKGYRRAQQIARASGVELAQTLELVIQEIQPDKLWLLANSMGGQVVADAFSLLYQQKDLADAQTEIDDVVLTAPDVGQQEFDQQFKYEITALARDLTVYASSNDRALLASRIVNRQRRLGTNPPDILNPDQSQAATDILELVEPDKRNITLVDVTPVNRTRNFHNFSLETPEFFDDLFLRLTNDETPQNRRLYPFYNSEGAVFWVLTQGR
jgi:esterase/lipase superfamily enzyme